MQQTRLDTGRIRAARRVIDPVFLGTPLYRCEALEPGLGCAVSIKLETANPVRSFKGRGTEVVASLLAEHGPRAVVCASAGNLGQALAWSGRGRGLDVTVVASRFATAAKLDRIRALGAGLELVDGDHELARERAAAIARYDGIRLVEDSLDVETCEGAATIGLELVEARERAKPEAQARRADLADFTDLTASTQLTDVTAPKDLTAPTTPTDLTHLTGPTTPTDLTTLTAPTERADRAVQAELPDPAPPFDAVLIALGGGALATGVGHVLKALAPGVEVICVQPLGAPALTRSWHERRVVTTDSTDTIADGVAGRRPIPAVLDDLLLVADDAVLVREASIIAGMRMLLDHAGLVVEPSAALGIAAILEDRDRFAGRHVVTIVCGGNVDGDAYRRWVGAAGLPHGV
ncbi:threonine/serine dehydratase [Streptomyces sp. N50]|uniref:threonine ammonia-lyase n=1 Tax=Streptomyces sp. N50 TaxID=3081765 RepID=UPI002961EF2D|nr:pyridoxal-phosphate dependent enzyme [Streptomyces sp. N50]WOX12153.1 pyridoxal-phosphate dependent enzyme [Streptomyces sp. N50]